MTKSFDVTKFRKSITKSIDGLSVGFNDPDTWISTGSFLINKLISGDFYKGVPLGKVTVLAGESGSGKSYLAAGNVVKHAQEQGIFVVLIDTENALDQSWLEALGVNTSDEKLLKLNMSMIDDVAKTISEFMKEYKSMSDGERPKVLFVIDSLGMLLTPTDVDQFDKGELKGDMGRKPKALTALVRNCVNMFGSYNVGLVATNHTYASQDPYNPDPNISGGAGFVYAASIVIAMKKLKLKEDEDGNKISEVKGIRAGCKIMKTRYAKPFEDAEIKIPYETGLDPYSGLFDFFEKKQVLRKEGNRYVYVDQTGTEHKYFRKEWNRNEKGILDLVMNEFHIHNKVESQKDQIDQLSQKNETESDLTVDNI
jgi:recombination protein RecA